MTQPTQAAHPEPEPSRAHVDALRSSVERLHDLAEARSEEDLTSGAYPAEWTVAQVLSHLGSGAVIMQRRLEDALAGQDTPDDFAPGVWSSWNAKRPVAQRDDALVADAALLAPRCSVRQGIPLRASRATIPCETLAVVRPA